MKRRRFTSRPILGALAAVAVVATANAKRNDPRQSQRFAFPPGRKGFPADEETDFTEGALSGMERVIDIFDNSNDIMDVEGDWDISTTEEVSSDAPSSNPYQGYSSSRSPNGRRAGGRSASYPPSSPSSGYRRQHSSYSSSSSSSPRSGPSSSSRFSTMSGSFFQPVTDWWQTNISPSVKNWPKVICVVEPTTTLKLRKTFRPLKTVVRLGADFNTQLGVWQFRSSWEDEIIGGKLTLAGRELQLTKSWQLSVGAVEDLVTRLRFRAAVDLSTWKAYARVGFRTERLRPINVMEGFTLWKQVPLDGNKGHVKLEVKANFALPEPEIEYSTETHRSLVGMGDIEVNIEELNLMLDY